MIQRSARQRRNSTSAAGTAAVRTTAVVRTAHLAAEEVEFLRWRAERWMKVRHVPSVLRHYPGYVLLHWPQMLAHTFRGSTWRSALGLESEWEVFRRYKAIRARERDYLPDGREDMAAPLAVCQRDYPA